MEEEDVLIHSYTHRRSDVALKGKVGKLEVVVSDWHTAKLFHEVHGTHWTSNPVSSLSV